MGRGAGESDLLSCFVFVQSYNNNRKRHGNDKTQACPSPVPFPGGDADGARYFLVSLLQDLQHVYLGELILVHFCPCSQTQSSVDIEAVATQF